MDLISVPCGYGYLTSGNLVLTDISDRQWHPSTPSNVAEVVLRRDWPIEWTANTVRGLLIAEPIEIRCQEFHNSVSGGKALSDELAGLCTSTRVIDLQDPEYPILRETYGLRHEYLTLSYCWGQGKRLLTEKGSGFYEELRQKIPVDETMPRTFKEAFQVTKDFGYRYLWVDALCIVQDDFDDVQKEMAQMGKIYRNSLLTISAVSGCDPSSGLFVEQDPRLYKPCNVTLAMMEGEERLQGTISIHVFDHGYENPLSKRGWVLQEEIISTRSLTFGAYGIRWRCIAESCSEGGKAAIISGRRRTETNFL